MAYQVLARKWRPKKFADLVGQEHVVKALVNALDKGRLHHAYLLTGTRGVGKTTIARILAKSLNCPDAHEGEPCGVCDSCRQIDAGRYVDLLEIDAASNTGIDNIREVLENAQYAPTLGRYKVYIIDEVHMLSKSAFNAMLKTLEEPPEHVKFILATTDPHKVPITVLSRCLQFVLRNLNVQQVHDHLAHVLASEGIEYQDAALQLLGRAAAGSMRDALSLLDQAIAMGSGRVTEADVRQMIGAVDTSYLYELLDALAVQDGEALLAKAADMAGRAIGFDSALNEMALLLQRLALLQTVPGAVADADPEKPRLQQLAARLSGEQIQLYYQCAVRGKHDLPLAPDEYAGFVMTLLRMLAFAPLAAEAHPPQARISGSQLQDPAPLQTADAAVQTADRLPETAAVEAEPSLEQATELQLLPAVAAAEEEPPAALHAQEAKPVAETEVLPPLEADSVPPWEDAAVSEAVPEEAAADEALAVPQSDMVVADEAAPVTAEIAPPASIAAADSAADRGTEAEEIPLANPPVEAAADTEAETDASTQPLPEISAANWPQIMTQLAHKLGAVQLFSLHTAVAHFDAAQGRLQLAITNEGEFTADKERLHKLGAVLSEAYGRDIRVSTQAWREEEGLETQVMRRERLQQEARQQAQDYLEADAAARDIIDLFDAQWLPESLALKQPDSGH
ncbi:DNA polymerase-3 subunit gamma/tau [Neisseria sp. HSC-16F19]|nr:DNA polymerase III subunit gamma/tau [Neisseria sp. HSC-16F19]MCP2041324.1 DNA polymerase-3 subunit gamma/tau [Neisseria sp. HSC-16F19]